MAEPIVELHALQYQIGERLILDLPEWQIESGQHSLILGPSGSGKTTLLHLIAGFIKPKTGQISVAGQLLTELSPTKLDAFRGRHIGVVFQTLHLLDALTVANNLRLAQTLAGLPRDDERVLQDLNTLGIADKAQLRPHKLSQGEAQRVAIARAVINRPKLILADEPTSALDDRSCEQVVGLLLTQAERYGSTLLVATHDSRLQAHFEQRLELAG